MRPFIKLILPLFLFFYFFPTFVFSQSLKLSSVNITVLNNDKTPDETKKLIPFQSGDLISKENLKSHVAKIEKLNSIKEIEYDLTKTKANSYHLDIKITEYKFIRDIRIYGNAPFLNKDFKRIIPLQPGTPLDLTLIPKSIENILNFLKKNGFYESEVSIETRPHRKFNTVDLLIKIKKGKTYRLDQVHIKGNKHIPTRTLRGKISRWGRFREERLKENIEKIKKLYRKKGFIKARVKLQKIKFNEQEKTVDVYVNIRENKKLILKITGKTGLSKGKIKQILNFAERRSYDRYTIRMSEKRLEAYYHQNGYPSAQVRTEVEKTADEVIITYFINAKQRVELTDIRFEGNENFSNKKLKKQILSTESSLFSKGLFRESRLQKDANRLETFYIKQGYLDAKVDPPQITKNEYGDHIYVTFIIHEGERYEIDKITLTQDKIFPHKRLFRKAGLKKGKTLTSELIEKAKTKIYDQLFEKGYAYAKVKINATAHQDSHTVDLEVVIQRGEKVHVRNIIVKGHHITQKKIILRNLQIQPGDLFVYQKVLDAQLNLRKLGIFSTVQIEPIGFQEKKTEIDLYVFVNELETHVLKAQIGFDNRSLGRGEASFTKRNLFGLAKQLNIRGIAGQKFNRGELTFFSPRLFGASWNLANQYFGQYENAPQFNAYSYGGFINTLKNFGPHWTFGFKEAVTHTQVLEDESNVAALGNSLFDNTFNELSFYTIFDNRDNFADPQNGFYILAREELNLDLSDFNNNFNTISFNLSHHKGFLGRFTLNNSFRYGHHVKIATSPRIPVNKLFFLGGADTVRGFSEDGLDPSGGTVYFIYNTELHFRIMDSIKVAGFFDAGVLADSFSEINKERIRESAGIGLRYFTPIGPVRLDYGFILDRRAGEPASRLHFSFGFFF